MAPGRPRRAKKLPGARTFQSVDGRFEWDYLPPGEWAVTAVAAGYQRFELLGIQVPKGAATAEIVLPLRAGKRLRGRVYDEDTGVGIASATVSFRESDTKRFGAYFRMRPRFTSASDGTFVIDGLPAGRIALNVYAADYGGRELDVLVDKQTEPVEIGLSVGGTIAGRLTAADGVTPVKGSAGVFDIAEEYGGTRRTGEAGEFSFPNLPPGRYRLTGQADSGSASREIVLARNQRIEGIVLALSAGSTIRGVVTGLRGDDLKHVSISLRRDGDSGNPYADVRVDEAGAFVLKGVQPGRVQLVADVSMRRQMSKTVEVPADSDLTVSIDFPRGARLSGRVTRGGKPLAEVWLEPRPAVEQPVFIYGASTSKDGEYVIEDLAAGEYAVFVGGYKSRPVRIAGDTVFDIEVPLTQLSGRVLEEGGKVPVVAAGVEIWSAEPASARIRLHDSSDHFGQFALAGLEPGDFLLTVYKPGYEMIRERIAYESPVAGMTIRLRREMGVSIRVREAGSGKPVRQTYVIEQIGERNGIRLQLRLDDEGAGYIPGALAGSTLSFFTSGYVPAVVRSWNGQALDLQLERQLAQ